MRKSEANSAGSRPGGENKMRSRAAAPSNAWRPANWLLELLHSPDDFDRAFGCRNPPIPVARLWNAGGNCLHVANDDPLFGRQLSVLRDDILARISESRCAKRHRERDGRAPGQPTEPVKRSHGPILPLFSVRGKRNRRPKKRQNWPGQLVILSERRGIPNYFACARDREMSRDSSPATAGSE